MDANGDGRAEAVFVGKYLLWPDGTSRCTLPGWTDHHVDSMVVADLDAALPGLEVLAVGASGTRFYGAGGCAPRWTITSRTIDDAQQTAATHFGAASPSMLVTTKLNGGSDETVINPLRGYVLDARGKVVSSYVDDAEIFAAPLQNANLDGAPAAEDRVATFGQVVDRGGRLRLSTSWYWNLQDLTPAERALDVRDQWARSGLVFDLDNDGRHELVVWGRRKLVAGTLAD